MTPTPTSPERRRALAAMITAALLFAGMAAFTKAVTRVGGTAALSGGEVAFFRYGFGLLYLLGLHFATGADLLGNNRKGLLLRGIYGGIASVSYFVAIGMTSLTHASLLNYISVVWGSLLAIFTLGEQLSGRALLAIGAALLGVILVLHPQVGVVNVGDVVALVSGILSGAAVVQVRKLRQGESAYAVFFYFNLIGLPIALLSLWASHATFRWPTGVEWGLLCGVGVTSVGGQLLMTFGYRDLMAAQGSLIILSTVAFSALLSYCVFQEAITLYTLVGGALVLTAAILFAIAPTKRQS